MMDWLMLAFLGILVLLLAYYLFRQRKDPGVKVFPFNQVNFQAGSPPEGEERGAAGWKARTGSV